LLKYRHDKFSVYILETYESDKLISREQYYFNLLTPIYNIFKLVSSNQGYINNKETCKAMSKIKLEDTKLMERILALAEINRGKNDQKNLKN
jgi:hypothetical protein